MGNFKFIFFVILFFLALPAHAQEYDKVHKCDEYAAHPNDSNRWTKGVTDDEIIPGPAVKFCREAVADYDETPRFQFQLGRALWAAHKFEEGLKIFLALEEASEYAPVYAYLGDAYMYGIGGVKTDEELAVSLYQIADEEGFAPAGEVLANLLEKETSNNTEALVTTQQEIEAVTSQTVLSTIPQDLQRQPSTQERPFEKSIYLEPELMAGFYHGDMAAVRLGTPSFLDVDKAYFYIGGFLKPLQENYNFRDANCVYLSNPNLVRYVNTKVMQGMPGVGGIFVGNGRSLEQNLNAGSKMGWDMLGGMLKGMNSGQGILGSEIGRSGIETTLLTQKGEKDSTRLIDQHGCNSTTVRQIFANMVHFVTGEGSPVISVEEKQRLEKAKAEKAKLVEEKRQKQFRVTAGKSCVAQFKKETYCGCLIKNLDTQGIGEDEWKRLGKSFREVIVIGKNYSGFATQIKTCRSGG